MYNGIGLKTTRGSGTNGYIQRNLSNLKPRDDWRKDRASTDFKDDIGARARQAQPDAGILDHERKRKVEVRCLELQDELEEQGLPPDQVEEQVSALRKKLQEELANPASSFGAPTRNETRSLRPSDTHALRQAKTIEEAKMQRALGIDSDYKEGDAFDRELQERKKLQRIEERRLADEARRADWERKKQLDLDRKPARFDADRRRDYRDDARRGPPPGSRFDDRAPQSSRDRRDDYPRRRAADSRSPSPPPRKRNRADSTSPAPRRKRRSPSFDSRSPSPPPRSRKPEQEQEQEQE